MKLPPVLAVVGPTASGKTRRAVELAGHLDGEIVSADSRQIYRGMDIGTGKDLGEYGSIPYHLVDIAPAGYKYNLFEYLRDCRAAVEEIYSRHKLPIIAGGTGMYIESYLKGMYLPEVPTNHELRASLEGLTLTELTTVLASMKRLHNTTDIDTKARAIRAIEIEHYYIEHPDKATAIHGGEPIPSIIIGIDITREDRRRRISERLRHRLEQEDMCAEVERLLAEGVKADDLIYYGLEYKYLTLYVTGAISEEEMKEKLEIAIHQFAKRQMTWFRGMERRGFTIHWLPYDMPGEEFVDTVSGILRNYGSHS